MAKKILSIIKLQIPAGQANPAPPVGPALGQHGVNIMEFCKQYNERTKDQVGQIVPVEITVYVDKTFTFVCKTPPTSALILKELGIEKGSQTAGKKNIGILTQEKVEKIAKIKMKDLNTDSLENAKKIVLGTAKSMGIGIG